jgi:hypothetical protein
MQVSPPDYALIRSPRIQDWAPDSPPLMDIVIWKAELVWMMMHVCDLKKFSDLPLQQLSHLRLYVFGKSADEEVGQSMAEPSCVQLDRR